MATPLRKQSPSIKKQLFDKPYEFEFSQAVKLLEILYAHKEKIGIVPRSDLDAVRIKSTTFLSTPPSDLYSLSPPENENFPAILNINFMGIAGQTGPLPNVYGELIMDRVKSKDYAFLEFLDLFNNRLNGIHYRIQVKYNISLSHSLPDKIEAAKVLKYFGGLTQASPSTSQHIPLRSYVKYAGLLWQKPRSAAGLHIVLEDYFQLPFEIEQFQGQWTILDQNQQTFIGKKGQYDVLGEDAALGVKAWIHGEKIRLDIGPLDLETYISLLPGKEHNKRVAEFTRYYLGCENYFDYKLSLKRDHALPTKLDGKSVLGWTAWMNKTAIGYTPDSIVVKSDDPMTSLI